MRRTSHIGSAILLAFAATALASSETPRHGNADPRVSLARLPLTFEKNTGRYNKRVKFLTRTGGATVFLTDTGTVMVLPGKAREKLSAESREPRAGRAEGSLVPTMNRRAVETNPASAGWGPNRRRSVMSAQTGDSSPGKAERPLPTMNRRANETNPASAGWGPNRRRSVSSAETGDSSPGNDGRPLSALSSQPSALSPQFSALSPQPSADRHVLRMNLVGALPGKAVASGMEKQQGIVNYFMGNDPKQWRTNIPTYAKAKLAGVYPGIDVVYYGVRGERGEVSGKAAATRHSPLATHLEYDFVVKPGADPSRIRLAFEGADKVRVANGDLILSTPAGDVRMKRPYAYQTIGGKRVQVACDYRLHSPLATHHSPRVAFRLAKYDTTRPLVVDPVVEWATWFGTRHNDWCHDVTTHPDGSAIIVGSTDYLPPPDDPPATDAYVAKFNSSGGLDWMTVLGGNKVDVAYAVAVNAGGVIYVGGASNSPDFPVTPGAFDTHQDGEIYTDSTLVRLDSAGHIVWGTFIGWASSITDMAVTSSGDPIIAGYTLREAFPATPGSYDPVGPPSYMWVNVPFVARMAQSGSSMIWGTYVWGSSATEWLYAVAVDTSDNVLLAGYSNSWDYPTTPNAYQPNKPGGSTCAWVGKLAADGSSFLAGTWFHYATSIMSIDSDASGRVLLAGSSDRNVPTTTGAYSEDWYQFGFTTVLTSDLSAIIWSTHLPAGAHAVRAAFSSAAEPIVYNGWKVIRLNAAGTTALAEVQLMAEDPNVAPGVRGVSPVGATHAYAAAGWNDYENAPVVITPNAYRTTHQGGHDAYLARVELATTTTLIASDASGVAGEAVPLSATLSAGTSPLSGRSLSFAVEGSAAGSATTNASGVASLSYNIPLALAVGPHQIRASFAGDADYSPSSGTATLTVARTPTKTNTIDRTGVGASAVALRGYLYKKSDSSPLSSKTLVFQVAGTQVGTATTGSTGSATLSWIIDAGDAQRQIRVNFEGDGEYEPSFGTAKLTVLTYDSTLLVPNRAGEIGDAVSLRAYLYRSPQPLAVSGKTVGFLVDGTSVGSAVTNTNGRALLSWVVPDTLAPGAHALVADWPGDAGYRPSSGTATLTVDKGVTYVWLMSRSMARGTSAYLRTLVRRMPDLVPLPNKTIQFSVDGTALGTAMTGTDGRASYLYVAPSDMTTGDHQQLAEFAGDTHYLPGAGTAILTITP